MGTIISKINDEIKLHGSYEAYIEFRDMPEKTHQRLLDRGDIPYFPDLEEVTERSKSTSENLYL